MKVSAVQQLGVSLAEALRPYGIFGFRIEVVEE